MGDRPKRPESTLLYSPNSQMSISLLSSEAESPNYRGFLNLGAIILFVTNFRLIIENIVKYGFLLHIPSWNEVIFLYASWPCLFCTLLLSVPLSICFAIEHFLGAKLPQVLVTLLQSLNILVTLAVPPGLIKYSDAHFVPAFFLLLYTLVAAMKEYSFYDVMKEVRVSFHSEEYQKYPKELKEVIAKYPNITSFRHFVYFVFTPTLCFQFKYPRTERVRKVWLFKRICEFVLSLSVAALIIQQYIEPLILNTLQLLHTEEINYVLVLERHLKLAVPSLYLWLLLFFNCFQCYTNIMAELTTFGDRTFYLEWWNARTLGEYWRLWNIPVHSWLFRHIYIPIVAKGFNKNFSIFVTFAISAVAHEYIFSSALKIVSCWAFTGMMLQIPMIILGDLFKNQLQKSQLGNVIFWVTFCIVGQPAAILVYWYQVVFNLSLL